MNGVTNSSVENVGTYDYDVFGEPADLINAGIYYLRGDNVKAVLSAGVAIPLLKIEQITPINCDILY